MQKINIHIFLFREKYSDWILILNFVFYWKPKKNIKFLFHVLEVGSLLMISHQIEI